MKKRRHGKMRVGVVGKRRKGKRISRYGTGRGGIRM